MKVVHGSMAVADAVGRPGGDGPGDVILRAVCRLRELFARFCC